ncbi:MAG: RNA polymerase sigma factor [Alistipes sp.]|nr:RNA polymerase sigma factor [Alistipes sp.]
MVSLDHISFQLFEESVSVSPEYILISRQNVDKINSLIDSLPAKCKMAFKLVKEDKLTYKEAAEIMEVSVNTIDAHIFKAVKIIKEELEKPTPVKNTK